MKKEKIKLEDIKEKEISEEDKDKNEKENKKRKVILYTIPLTIVIVMAIIYFLTTKIIFLILFGIILFIFLFGWDGNSRICPECHKWNSMIWISNKNITKKTTFNKKNLLGKDIQKQKEEKLIRKEGKCINCGKISTIDKKRIIHL